MPGVIISVGPKTGASTDINGDYILSVPSGTYALECTMIGYKVQKQTITVVAGDTLKLNFTLVDGNTMLEEVVVSAALAVNHRRVRSRAEL